MRRVVFPFLSLLTIVALFGCGGGGGNSEEPSAPQAQRGDLLESPPTLVATYSPNELLALLDVNRVSEAFLDLLLDPVCTVNIYQLKYQTVDPADELTPASGALMVPSGQQSECAGMRPIILYAHGTSVDRDFNIADAENNGEGALLAVVFAAAGYIVVAPNYVGYDTSTLNYHP